MAAQDFRHSLQRDGEVVSDFIRRLEKTYKNAYGKDDLNAATRDTLLYGQLYEGLCYDPISPVVSGAQEYGGVTTHARYRPGRCDITEGVAWACSRTGCRS